jgi:hypothetical protein
MFQHHNPTISRPIIARLLSELGEQWEELSYHNDTMASVGFETLEGEWIQIFVPNALECDATQEEYSVFRLNVCDVFYPRYNTIEELLEAFKGGVSEFYETLEAIFLKEA